MDDGVSSPRGDSSQMEVMSLLK